nr:PREDICTED: uncharacterized protein LOC108217230 [Daucus carota subsp. sativus]
MSIPEHSMNLSWTQSFDRTRICAVNITVLQCVHVLTEVAPGIQTIANEYELIAGAGHEENPIEPVEFSFDDVRSRRINNLCEQVINSCNALHPATKKFLVDNVVDCGTKLASLRPENGVDCGYEIDAFVKASYFRVADEEELQSMRRFDDMDDDDNIEDDGIEDMDEDEANSSFIGVEKGKYEGKEVITCSVCLEDLSSGMEFEKLPCSHVFHSNCIDHWLKRNRTCPNCRTRLTKLEEQGLCSARCGTVVWY